MMTQAQGTHDKGSHGHAKGEQETHGNLGSVRQAYDATLEKAGDVLGQSREAVRGAAERTATGIEANPLAVLVGGLAVGAVAASLIPRSDREKELLAPVGKRIGAAAAAALAAAKEAGRDELSSLGLSRDAVKERAEGLKGGLGRTLSSVSEAALKAAKDAKATNDA